MRQTSKNGADGRQRWTSPALLLVITAIAGMAIRIQAADPPKVLFEENFAGKLSPGWQWIRERPQYWHIVDGSLILDTLSGSNWGKQNSGKNILLRPAPASLDDGFALEVHLENSPKGQFENAGLLCYFDPSTFVCMNKESGPKGGGVFAFSQQDGNPSFSKIIDYGESGIWLRLILHGKKAIAQYRSTETDPWHTIGDCPIPASANPPLVGLKAWYGHDKPVRQAKFRSFRVVKVAE